MMAPTGGAAIDFSILPTASDDLPTIVLLRLLPASISFIIPATAKAITGKNW